MRTNALPRCHWNKQHGRRRKAKRAFDTIFDANQYIEKRNLQSKYKSYQCPVCGKFHIGHRNKDYEKV